MAKRHAINELASRMFNYGLSKKEAAKLKPLEGISKGDAVERWRRIEACLGSRQPKHEHKIAGVAFLLSRLFTETSVKGPEDADLKHRKAGARRSASADNGRACRARRGSALM